MQQLVSLGKTTRSVSTFGDPVLVDQTGTSYQHVANNYKEALERDNSFRMGQNVALDFKLVRAKGRSWPEPPKVHDQLVMYIPELTDEPACTGEVSYVHLGHNRAVGVLYLDKVRWIHTVVSNIFQ